MIIGSKWKLVGFTDDKEYWSERCELDVIYTLIAIKRHGSVRAALVIPWVINNDEWVSCPLTDNNNRKLRENPEAGFQLRLPAWRSLTTPGVWEQVAA